MTDFAKALRILRIERGEVLKDMADKLGITSSYLSAIECGKRKIPNDFCERVISIYGLSREDASKLRDAMAKAKDKVEIVIPFTGLSSDEQEVALKFARSFKEIPTVDMSSFINKLRQFVDNKEEE